MSFLYPLFLVAGLSLAIPVLIHLFNLRRYKTVLFPHTRFLKNIQLKSQKQSQLRYKWLLATRLLFLACLIAAFAQPFFKNKNATATANRLQVIYIDNSNSMSVKKGASTLLELSKEMARRQVNAAAPGTRFLLLTNDKPASYHAEPAGKVLTELGSIDLSPKAESINQLLASVQGMVQNETADGADLYYYSDFQKTAFPDVPDTGLMRNIAFYGMPFRADELNDIFIDTAYLSVPVLQTGKTNYLIVHTSIKGQEPKEAPVVQLTVNGQVKSAATINFNGRNESTDTLSFLVNDANWQQLQLTVNDVSVKYDDTFRIAARSAANLSVLVLNEGQANPYIQAAFRAYNGFRLNQQSISTASADWSGYNLVILNGVTAIDDHLGKLMSEALQQGRSICIFPGRAANLESLNAGLKQIGDISFTHIDTAVQAASGLQQGSALVKDLFEKIPDNVQLPVANWHYVIVAGLAANQQSVLSFRNGDPMLARYTPTKGQFYICATSADLQSGNFPGSYFFTPFLYEMAVQSGASNIYAITGGSSDAVYLPMNNVSERNTIHAFGKGMDVIPPQKPDGAGLDVFLGQVVQQPGFYSLAAATGDTTQVALNPDNTEPTAGYRDLAALKKQWQSANIHWPEITGDNSFRHMGGASFPLWKVCVILALLMLAAETWLLARQPAPANAAQ